jgi:hypothetical protein
MHPQAAYKEEWRNTFYVDNSTTHPQVTNKKEWKGTFCANDPTLFEQGAKKEEWQGEWTKLIKNWTTTMSLLHFEMNDNDQARLWL